MLNKSGTSGRRCCDGEAEKSVVAVRESRAQRRGGRGDFHIATKGRICNGETARFSQANQIA